MCLSCLHGKHLISALITSSPISLGDIRVFLWLSLVSCVAPCSGFTAVPTPWFGDRSLTIPIRFELELRVFLCWAMEPPRAKVLPRQSVENGERHQHLNCWPWLHVSLQSSCAWFARWWARFATTCGASCRYVTSLACAEVCEASTSPQCRATYCKRNSSASLSRSAPSCRFPTCVRRKDRTT